MMFLKRILLIIISLLMLILNLELFLRFTYKRVLNETPWQINNPYKMDDDLIFSFKAQTHNTWTTDEFTQEFKTNNYAFRNINNIESVKSKNTYRIVLVGDSFTFGHGLKDNQTYPYLLEKYLNSYLSKDKKFEVINAGIPGYSPDQEYKQILKKLINFQPDLIIWNIIFYDLYDLAQRNPSYPSLYEINNNKLFELNPKVNSLYLRNYFLVNTPNFLKKSYTFDFILSKLFNNKILDRKPNLTEKELIHWAIHKLILEIESVYELGKKNGYKLLIVRIPTKEEVSSSQKKDPYSSNFTFLESELKRKNISYFNIVKELYEKQNFEKNSISNNPNYILGAAQVDLNKIFFLKDGHPNELGAEIFAREVSTYLTNDSQNK